jgi:signal transduction histidine kinase
MFHRLQLKMTVVFSLILVTILFVTNVVVYIAVSNYNRIQLSTDVMVLLQEIENQGWEYDTTLEHPKTKDLVEPSALRSFSTYIVYSEKDEIVNFKIDDLSLWKAVQEASKKMIFSDSPQLLKIDAPTEAYYLLAKRSIVVNDQSLGDFFVGRNVTIAYKTLENLVKTLIISMIISSFTSLVFGYYIAGKSIHPIKETYESKQMFLANVSHELRTPLSVIMLSANTLEVEIDEKESFQQEVVADIKDEAKKMSDLVENLLMLSRNESNKNVPLMERINFSELLKQELERFYPLFLEKSLHFEEDIEPRLFIDGDRKLLISVITILVENAIKYTPEKGHIALVVKKELRQKQWIKLSIKDTGIGIPENEIHHIFERFYRVENSRSRKTGGYGLGLSIAKEIIDLHKGRIYVNSKVDEGSEFILEFLLALQIL